MPRLALAILYLIRIVPRLLPRLYCKSKGPERDLNQGPGPEQMQMQKKGLHLQPLASSTTHQKSTVVEIRSILSEVVAVVFQTIFLLS